MFGPTLRPALRPLTRVARQFSTEPLRPSSSRGTRTAAITSLTLLVGGVAYSASSRTLRADSRFRESVLDQPSLKENIHPRPGAAEGKAVVEEKQHEAESSQQGAFNEETGEINWDCPCLGGMADGPCGEQFKAAFSCFVFSEAEPKGMDCVDRFKGMQDCFREHPDVYGEEIDDDEEEGDSQIEGIVSSNSSNDGVPATPNKNPPKNSPTLGAHQDNAMTKNASTLH